MSAPDTHKSSRITDHPFQPSARNSYLCGHAGCRLAEAAHTTSVALDEKGLR